MIRNTPKFVDTAYTSTTYSNGSLWLENIHLSNVATAVQDNGNDVLAASSGSMTISGWGQGHSYSPSGPHEFQGPMQPASRPSALLASGTSNYLTQSKPQYEASPVASFLSVRAAGAKGDGQTDDIAALNAALQSLLPLTKFSTSTREPTLSPILSWSQRIRVSLARLILFSWQLVATLKTSISPKQWSRSAIPGTLASSSGRIPSWELVARLPVRYW